MRFAKGFGGVLGPLIEPASPLASLESADLVEAATDLKLLVSASLTFRLDVEDAAAALVPMGAVLGIIDSRDGVDDVGVEEARSSGVEMVELSAWRAAISGVEIGVGVLL